MNDNVKSKISSQFDFHVTITKGKEEEFQQQNIQKYTERNTFLCCVEFDDQRSIETNQFILHKKKKLLYTINL